MVKKKKKQNKTIIASLKNKMQSFVSESRDRHSIKNNRVTWLAPGHALPSNLLWFALSQQASWYQGKRRSLYYSSKYLLIFLLLKFVLSLSLCFYIVLAVWAGIDMWTSFVFWQHRHTTCLQKMLQLWAISQATY